MDRIRLLERRDIDELIILDIAATRNNRSPRFDAVRHLCENLFCPATVGGGVKHINDVTRLLKNGADKVSIGTAATENPQLISDAAAKFGSQAVVVSIDATSAGRVRTRCGSKEAGYAAVDLAAEVERRGAGEILLTSIDRDGMLDGYDLDLIRDVAAAVSIPVIACGGCGEYRHMQQAFEAGAHAVASGAMFQFTDTTPKEACRYLHERGVAVRL